MTACGIQSAKLGQRIHPSAPVAAGRKCFLHLRADTSRSLLSVGSPSLTSSLGQVIPCDSLHSSNFWFLNWIESPLSPTILRASPLTGALVSISHGYHHRVCFDHERRMARIILLIRMSRIEPSLQAGSQHVERSPSPTVLRR